MVVVKPISKCQPEKAWLIPRPWKLIRIMTDRCFFAKSVGTHASRGWEKVTEIVKDEMIRSAMLEKETAGEKPPHEPICDFRYKEKQNGAGRVEIYSN